MIMQVSSTQSTPYHHAIMVVQVSSTQSTTYHHAIMIVQVSSTQSTTYQASNVLDQVTSTSWRSATGATSGTLSIDLNYLAKALLLTLSLGHAVHRSELPRQGYEGGIGRGPH